MYVLVDWVVQVVVEVYYCVRCDMQVDGWLGVWRMWDVVMVDVVLVGQIVVVVMVGEGQVGVQQLCECGLVGSVLLILVQDWVIVVQFEGGQCGQLFGNGFGYGVWWVDIFYLYQLLFVGVLCEQLVVQCGKYGVGVQWVGWGGGEMFDVGSYGYEL